MKVHSMYEIPTSNMLGYNKETTIEGIVGQEGDKEKTCQGLCHLQIGDVIKIEKKK